MINAIYRLNDSHGAPQCGYETRFFATEAAIYDYLETRGDVDNVADYLASYCTISEFDTPNMIEVFACDDRYILVFVVSETKRPIEASRSFMAENAATDYVDAMSGDGIAYDWDENEQQSMGEWYTFCRENADQIASSDWVDTCLNGIDPDACEGTISATFMRCVNEGRG